jgi:hypothetical protein
MNNQPLLRAGIVTIVLLVFCGLHSVARSEGLRKEIRGLPSVVQPPEDSCDEIRRELAVKKRQMVNYSGAVKKLNDHNDAPIVGLLNHKITELADQINKMDAELRECSALSESESEISQVKVAQEDLYGAKSCGELRRMLVQLIRKVNSLKRRETSLFSELTQLERNELEAANEELAKVRTALKSRCAEPPKGRSSAGIKLSPLR